MGEEVLILSSRLKRKDSPGKFYKSSIENKPPYFKLGVSLKVGEEVLILSSRLKRKDSPGKFYKSSIENKPPYFDKDKTYFNKDKLFQITNRENIAGKNIYWVKNTKTEKKLKN